MPQNISMEQIQPHDSTGYYIVWPQQATQMPHMDEGNYEANVVTQIPVQVDNQIEHNPFGMQEIVLTSAEEYSKFQTAPLPIPCQEFVNVHMEQTVNLSSMTQPTGEVHHEAANTSALGDISIHIPDAPSQNHEESTIEGNELACEALTSEEHTIGSEAERELLIHNAVIEFLASNGID